MVNSRKIKIYRQRFEEVKKIKKKTMLQICDEAQVKYETVRYCLRNGSMMPDVLNKLAKTVDCDVGYLTGEHSFIHDDSADYEICGVDSNGIEILRYASYLQNEEYDYDDYSFDKKWAIREELFTKFIKLCEEEIKVRDIDLPSEYRNIPHNYGLTDFIKEYNQGLKGIPAAYDADGMRLDETAYGYLAVEVIEYLHKFIAEKFVNDMKASEGDK